jgi:uncharacterized protein (DUF2384 family)
MKKIEAKNGAEVYKHQEAVQKTGEPAPAYRNVKINPSVKDFTFNEFKKIADKAPFTQAEWSAILHISERTLQRYAKSNSSFASINAERALQIANLIQEGKKTFGKVELFYDWIKSNPVSIDGRLSFDSLTSYDGIVKLLTQLGRIQHGILA